MDPALFWNLSFWEYRVILQGASAKLEREQNDKAWLAWHTAHLTAYAPAKSKDFQRLETLLHGAPKKPNRPQTVEEQIAIAHRWTAALTRH